MIKILEVTNLEGHKYSLLEFDKGVNIIKGRTHSGKSSLIRAIIWALQNKPQGFHFKSHFSKKKDTTQVSIEFEENNSFITRTRDSKFNGYIVSSGKTLLELEALRADMPEEVNAISHMGKINFQSQAEKYFMLQETPGFVARELNKLAGLDIIDEVNSKVSKIIRDAKTNRIRIETEIEEKEKEIAEYKGLSKIEKLIEQITFLSNKCEEYIHKEQEIKKQILTLETKLKEKDVLDDWLKVEKLFKKIKQKHKEVIAIQEEETKLSDLVRRCKKANDEILLSEEIISLESTLKKAKKLNGELTEIKNKHDKLKKLYDDIQSTEKSLNFVANTLLLDIKKKEQLLKQYANDFCSKCGAYRQHWRKE